MDRTSEVDFSKKPHAMATCWAIHANGKSAVKMVLETLKFLTRKGI